MSKPDDDALPPEVESAQGCWMDDDAPRDDPFSPAEDALVLNEKVRIEAAKRQLVHALLLQLDKREIGERQERVDRVLLGLKNLSAGGSKIVRPGVSRRRVWLIRALVAASIAFVVAVPFYVLQSNSALAALERITQAIDDPVDRTYRISVEPPDSLANQESHGKNRARPAEDHRAGLDGALLYVRGASRFVLCRQAPNGKTVMNGSNGYQQWLVRPDKPVLVSTDPSAFRIPMPENLASIALGEVRTSLANLRNGYELVELPTERLGDGSSNLWRHLRARKLDPSTKGPKTVSIWFDPTTYVIGRIEFDQIHFQGRPEPRRLTMSLISSDTFSPNWFEHNAHHPPEASVEVVNR